MHLARLNACSPGVVSWPEATLEPYIDVVALSAAATNSVTAAVPSWWRFHLYIRSSHFSLSQTSVCGERCPRRFTERVSPEAVPYACGSRCCYFLFAVKVRRCLYHRFPVAGRRVYLILV